MQTLTPDLWRQIDANIRRLLEEYARAPAAAPGLRTLGSGTNQAAPGSGSGTYVPQSRTISTVSPLSGGGDLTTDRTITTSIATARIVGRTTAGTGVMEQLTVTGPLALGAGTVTTSMATGKLIGRSTAGTGVMEEITVGSGLSLSGGTLTATGGAAFTGTASTTDATVTTCGTYTPTDLTTVTLTVTVSAVQDTHAAGAGYVLVGTFRRSGGTVTQIGVTTQVVVNEDDAAWDATLDVSGTAVRVRVTGKAATNINWTSSGSAQVAA